MRHIIFSLMLLLYTTTSFAITIEDERDYGILKINPDLKILSSFVRLPEMRVVTAFVAVLIMMVITITKPTVLSSPWVPTSLIYANT